MSRSDTLSLARRRHGSEIGMEHLAGLGRAMAFFGCAGLLICGLVLGGQRHADVTPSGSAASWQQTASLSADLRPR